MRTVTFRAVAGEDYKLKDIKVTGIDEWSGYGDIYVQKCDAEGSWNGMYYWLTPNGAGMPEGWYTDPGGDEAVGDDIVLKEGEGVFLTTTDSPLQLVASGKVPEGIVQVNAPCGYSMIGNPTPVAISLNLVRVTCSDEWSGYGDIYVQKCDAEGSWNGMYYWLTPNGAGMPEGWYTDPGGDEAVTGVDLEPGESLFVTSDVSELVFTFPAVL